MTIISSTLYGNHSNIEGYLLAFMTS
jgi:hypothetical protein